MTCELFRYEAAAYDHGFRSPANAKGFDDLDEALIYAAGRRHENGRVTSFTGRNVQDVRWRVRDTQTNQFHSPSPEHVEAAELLGGEAA